MSSTLYLLLVVRALYELARYDVIHLLLRSRSIQRHLPARAIGVRELSPESATTITNALVLAGCLYWKPVRCLQRSVCMVRLLRAQGVAARLVIGYRPAPFFSHAWVEVNGHVINDSPVYRTRLHILLTA